MEPQQRRERSRIAQRRSRAQRRRDYEGLQATVQSLETALEDLTESCLGFSDAVILALKSEDVSVLRGGIKPFMNHILSISRTVLSEESAGVCDEPETTPNTRNLNAARLSTKAQPQGQLIGVQLSPRLTYGLLPFATQANHAPLDVVQYLSPQRYGGFARALFWNTFVFGHAILEQHDSQLLEACFFYPLQIYSLQRVRDQILRRVRFKPSDVRIFVPSADIDVDNGMPMSSYTREELEYEAHGLRRDHDLIVRSMLTVQDGLDSYLEAAGVEQYLATRWGMKMEPRWSPDASSRSSSRDHGSTHHGWNVQNAERLISYLASRSRCLGDRIGFPITVVDEAASGLMNVNIR